MTKGVKQAQWEMCTTGLLGQPLKPSTKTVVARRGKTNYTYQPMAHFGYSS